MLKSFAHVVALTLSTSLSAQLGITLTQTSNVYNQSWGARLNLTNGDGSDVTIARVEYKVGGEWTTRPEDVINDTVQPNPNNEQNYTLEAPVGATHAKIVTSAGESNVVLLTYSPV